MKRVALFCCVCVMSTMASAQLAMPRIYEFSNKCPPEKPFASSYENDCVGCDEPEGLWVKKGHEKDFDICSNREIVNGMSRLKKCPDNFFFDRYGECVSCDSLDFISVMQKSDCDICPNREVVDRRNYGLHCQLKTCPAEAPLEVGGDCKPCNTEFFPTNSKEACEKCPNRKFLEKDFTVYQDVDVRVYMDYDVCVLKENPHGDAFWDLSEQMSVQLFYDIPYKVPSRWYSMCVDCRSEDRYRLLFKEQKAISCNEKEDIFTLPEFCAHCPNRAYVKGKCVFEKELPQKQEETIIETGQPALIVPLFKDTE